ncbi:MAG: tRNA uridine-5-carboxymethylaminomethyl(34) synthesis GTPase MnmE [Clostridiales bacterium]|nr:tRNA uridine-5-carboxymethylaminomethyl(34) synthesis GTPase MnmE [Clostridiales bacterium]
MDKPYCACATPPGVSGIAVIRMAGEGSCEVADKVFTIRRAAGDARTVSGMSGYTVAYGLIKDPSTGKVVDEVMLTRFCAPHSYTGEDSVEISCHGGLTVRQEILRVLLENGARMAEPGEFTKKAFLSGKMDLSQAEAVMDVIAADSDLALRAANSHLQGSLKTKIRELCDDLYSCMAVFEMWIDEPDDEDALKALARNTNALSSAREKMRDLLSTYRQGRILSERMNIVICGIPNSGKSSLLNYLSGYDRAIVTDVPGTTRDTLEVSTSMSGVPVKLIDTAGIRETDDVVEAIGVNRATDALSEADIVLWLVSCEEEDIEETLMERIMNLPKETKIGLLISKSDTADESSIGKKKSMIEDTIREKNYSRGLDFCGSISAQTGEGIKEIEDLVRKTYDELGSAHAQEVLLTNQRHVDHLSTALTKIDRCIELSRAGVSLEEPSLLLRTALEELGEITGDSVSDTLVDTIFSRFCVGK